MPPVDPLADVPRDGFFTRDAGPWALDKLGIVACYASGFGVACRRARRWYYVDGFAGPGVNVLRGGGPRALGTPLIALRTEPQFHQAVLLERNRIAYTALRARTAKYGNRAVAE